MEINPVQKKVHAIAASGGFWTLLRIAFFWKVLSILSSSVVDFWSVVNVPGITRYPASRA